MVFLQKVVKIEPMPIFDYNLTWILLNVFLAFVPVVFTIILRRKMPAILRAFFIFLWLLFLPNTIYLVTDLQWFPSQLLASQMPEQAALFAQYIILTLLGVFTYFFSLEPMGRLIKKMKSDSLNKNTLYIGLNFIIAFAVVLGKIQRTHSVYIFLDPMRVVTDIITTFTSTYLLFWVLVIGISINIIYFTCKSFFRKFFE